MIASTQHVGRILTSGTVATRVQPARPLSPVETMLAHWRRVARAHILGHRAAIEAGRAREARLREIARDRAIAAITSLMRSSST